MGDAVGCVEFCDGGFEGGEGSYFCFGEESNSMVSRCGYGKDCRFGLLGFELVGEDQVGVS